METLSYLKRLETAARKKILPAPTVESRLMRNKHYDWYEAKVNEERYFTIIRYPGGTVTTISPSWFSILENIGINDRLVCIRHARLNDNEPVEEVKLEPGIIAIIGRNSSRIYGIAHDGTLPDRFFSHEPEQSLRQALEKLAFDREPDKLPRSESLTRDYSMTMDALHNVFDQRYRA